jgi:hypothetical protein
MTHEVKITRRQAVGAAGVTGAALATGAGLGGLLGRGLPGHAEDAVAAASSPPPRPKGPTSSTRSSTVRTSALKVARSARAGTAKLRIVVTDAAGNRKTYKRKVVVPPRLR